MAFGVRETGGKTNGEGLFARPGDWDLIQTAWHNNVARGSAAPADGGTIKHGLDERPEFVSLETQSANRAYPKRIDDSGIVVGLVDPSGQPVRGKETVLWEARAPSAG